MLQPDIALIHGYWARNRAAMRLGSANQSPPREDE